MQYLVKLVGAPSLSMRDRIELETRYLRELERLVGGPEGVGDACAEALEAAAAAAWTGRAKPEDARFAFTAIN